jgi:hypothetical protein
MPVACSVVSEIRVTKVQPPSPAALPRQQAQPVDFHPELSRLGA